MTSPHCACGEIDPAAFYKSSSSTCKSCKTRLSAIKRAGKKTGKSNKPGLIALEWLNAVK